MAQRVSVELCIPQLNLFGKSPFQGKTTQSTIISNMLMFWGRMQSGSSLVQGTLAQFQFNFGFHPTEERTPDDFH